MFRANLYGDTETEVSLTVFDENFKPVELEITLRIHAEDAIVLDRLDGSHRFEPLFSSEIANIRAHQGGKPYPITDDDSDEWDSEINTACEKALGKYVDSIRSA